MSAENDTTKVFDVTPYLKLYIDKEGKWYQNGAEIVHPGVYKQFTQMLQRSADGKYFVRMGREICSVEVEDAPFVVIGIQQNNSGGLKIELNDGTTENFNPELFWIEKDNVPYVHVKHGVFHARFNRPAYYHIAEYIESHSEDEFYFRIDDGVFPIRTKDPGNNLP